MVFAHDTELALGSVAALVNTARDDVGVEVELLPDLRLPWTRSLSPGSGPVRGATTRTSWTRYGRCGRGWRSSGPPTRTARSVVVNELLRDARALPQLLKHDHWGYHLHATPLEAPLADRMAVEAGMAMIDVIRMGELSRLRLCAGQGCERVVVDLSKNRSRRFCEAGCGNRANVAAYRARRTQAG